MKLKGTEIRKSSRKRRTPVPYCPSPIGRDELSSNYVLKEESNDDCVETAADKKGKRRRCH